MKKVMLVLGIILLMSVGLLGCESGVSPPGSASPSGIAGTYVYESDSSSYMELHPDGTLYYKGWEGTVTGQWEVEGDILVIRYTLYGMGMTARADIRGNKLIDEDGGVWVKK